MTQPNPFALSREVAREVARAHQAETLLDVPDIDLCAVPWVFETGADVDHFTGEAHPYRTVFASCPPYGEELEPYLCPLADLTDEADDSVGRLMAAAPALLSACEDAQRYLAIIGRSDGAARRLAESLGETIAHARVEEVPHA